MYERPAEDKPVAPRDRTRARWRALAREAWQDIKSLIRVQRIDRDEVPLLSPSQAVLPARESALAPDVGARRAARARRGQLQGRYRGRPRDWLQRYFDTKDRKVSDAL